MDSAAPPAPDGAVIDLNADVGEGFGRWSLGDDDALLDVITSANVACGFHAGDPATMRSLVAGAAARGVAIGAHVAYRDLAGFGRRYVDATHDELVGDVLYQVGALDGIARAAGARVAYVKPHGALYNTITTGHAHAAAVIEAITAYDAELPVVGLARSPFVAAARAAGLSVVDEAYADRAYTAEGDLVSRRRAGAVLHDPAAVAGRVVEMVRRGAVEAVDGSPVALAPASVCVHGDSPGAVAMARAVREALEGAGVVLRPFTPTSAR